MITIEQKEFAAVLDRIARVVEKRNTIPILSHMLLRAEAGRLHVRGTDLDITVEASLAADITAPASFTLHADTLHALVRKLPEGATIQIEPGETGVAIKSGRSRFTLPPLPAQDFPAVPDMQTAHRFSLPRPVLENLLGRVAFAISTEETRHYLNGAFWHVSDERLFSVATDGHRLALQSAPAPEGSADMPGIIIPRKTVGEILRLAKGRDDAIALEISPASIRLQIGGTLLISKLIDGTFPDYQRVIPQRNEHVASAEREELLHAVDRVATIQSDRGRGIRLRFSAEKLELGASSADSGSSSEEMEIRFTSEPIETGYNAKYLAEALGAINGDVVKFRLGDAGSPVLITCHAADDFLTVLMPMRVTP